MKSPLGARKGEADGAEQGGAEGNPDAKFEVEEWGAAKDSRGGTRCRGAGGAMGLLENFSSKHGIGTK